MRTQRKFYEELEMLIEDDLKLRDKNIEFAEYQYEILYQNFTFTDEEIWYNDECIAENRTPEQCYIMLRQLIL